MSKMNLNYENKKQIVQSINSQMKLEIQDMNSVVSLLKRREENYVEILDFLMKHILPKASEIQETDNLYNQMVELESLRCTNEDLFLEKYKGYKTNKDHEKK